MYLLGYLSLFDNDVLMVEQTLKFLNIYNENFCKLYHALKEMEFDDVIHYYKAITEEATLLYLKHAFRRYYSPELLSDDEIEEITLDNYRDYIERLDRKMREMGLVPEEENLEEESTEEIAAFIAHLCTGR